jgi:hypothetical protein
MRTWSIADAIDDAKAITKYVASLALTPVLDWVYPPLGHDDDYLVPGFLAGADDSSAVVPRNVSAADGVPASSAAGASGEAVSAHSPAAPASPPLTFVDWAIPAILTVLDAHHYRLSGERCDCGFDDGDGLDPYDWRQHVAPLIAAHVEKALLASDFGK